MHARLPFGFGSQRTHVPRRCPRARVAGAWLLWCAASVCLALCGWSPASAAPPAPPAPAARALAAAGAPQPAASAFGRVLVDVHGVRDARGQLLIALYREPRKFPRDGRHAFGARRLPAHPGLTRVLFERVPPGAFAIAAHHDADGDGEMDTNLFGVPTEGYGFSRDASAPFGPPSFAAARLWLSAGELVQVAILLRY